VRAGVERPGAEQLRPGQDDGERLQGALLDQATQRCSDEARKNTHVKEDNAGVRAAYQARGPPADADLLAGQPHGEEGEGPGDERGGGGGHHVGREPLVDVVQAGEGGGDADDAGDEREDDEEPRRQVADREVDREQANRRGHDLHCTNPRGGTANSA
jgi:hypothetical protein